MIYINDRNHINLSRKTAVTLGKFDGIHIGHRLLIDQIVSSKEEGLTPVMFTFSSANVIRKDSIDSYIYTEDEKREILEEMGLDILISYPFDDDIKHMDAERFIKDILVDQLQAKRVVVGSDYCFGYQRQGNVDLLLKSSARYGYKCIVYDKICLENTVVSSTSIRNELLNGNIELVNRMLGREYSITGEVQYGNQIGRTLGMPTANIRPATDKLLPPNGVYVTKIRFDDNEYAGITNIGYKPTIGGETQPGVETYIFDYNGHLYGKKITVQFCTFVRGEQKFSNLERLKEQMHKDMAFGRSYFK